MLKFLFVIIVLLSLSGIERDLRNIRQELCIIEGQTTKNMVVADTCVDRLFPK